MAETIRMPEILAGAAEGAIQTWLVSPGTQVAVGQALAEIETDKAIVELTSEVAGVVGQLLIAEGESITVGAPILVLLGEGESAESVTTARAAGSEQDTPPDPGRRLFVSPLVRRLAREAGIDLADVSGTGPQGRIVRRDFERHRARHSPTTLPPAARTETAGDPGCSTAVVTKDSVSPTPPVERFQDVPLARMRKAIARRLTESKTTVPHFYLVADCRVDALLELRRAVNCTISHRISVNDFVLKAVASALVEVPAANAVWNTESIRYFSSVDISVAVATEGGLLTPVLRDVERLTLSEVSASVAELAGRAREGRVKQHELEGGSFSVSNLGMYGTAQFSAILNPPQSGILAVGAARAMPVVGDDGALTVGQIMTVTLSADHRVLDGAVAAQWLAAFQKYIENPLSILV